MKIGNLNMLKTEVLRPMAGTLALFLAITVHRFGFDRKQIPAYRLLLCLVSATTIVWAVGCNEKGDSASTISGIVLDSISQAPIDSAWVSTSESSIGARYTDSTGSFILTSFGRPNRIFAGKAGYHTKTQSIPGTDPEVKGVRVELVSDTL